MTLLVRDEADIVDAQIAYHLDAGVDLVVATDNRSQDGTTEILERYERDGVLHLIREPGNDLRQSEWVTRMARLAATDFGADWILNADADEFWHRRGGGLRSSSPSSPNGSAQFGGLADVRAAPGRRAILRRAHDRAPLHAELPSPSAQHALQVGASRPPRCADRPRQPRGARRRSRRPPRLVPDRDPPLPRALARAVPQEVRHAVRRARAERGEGHPRAHGGGVRRLPRRRARRVLRAARRRRRDPECRPRGRDLRDRRSAARRAAPPGASRTGTPGRPRTPSDCSRSRRPPCSPAR